MCSPKNVANRGFWLKQMPLLICTLEIPGSNLGRSTDPLSGFCGFPQALRKNSGTLSLKFVNKRLLPRHFQFVVPPVILPYDVTQFGLLTQLKKVKVTVKFTL